MDFKSQLTAFSLASEVVNLFIQCVLENDPCGKGAKIQRISGDPKCSQAHGPEPRGQVEVLDLSQGGLHDPPLPLTHEPHSSLTRNQK